MPRPLTRGRRNSSISSASSPRRELIQQRVAAGLDDLPSSKKSFQVPTSLQLSTPLQQTVVTQPVLLAPLLNQNGSEVDANSDKEEGSSDDDDHISNHGDHSGSEENVVPSENDDDELLPDIDQPEDSDNSQETTLPEKRITKRKREVERSVRPLTETILNQKEVVTLDNEISEALAQKFYEQALRPTFNMHLDDLIQFKALKRIRFKIMTKYSDLSLPEGADVCWPVILGPDGQAMTLSLLVVAEQIKILFGTPNQADSVLDLDRRLREVIFTFSYENDNLEQSAWFTFTEEIENFYRTTPNLMTPQRSHHISTIFSNNLPRDHEVTRLYFIKRKQEIGSGDDKLDDYVMAYRRFVTIMTKARKQFKKCLVYGSFSQVFKKDPTFTTPVPSRSAAAKAAKPLSNSAKSCHNCGKIGHLSTTCRYLGNPRCNPTTQPWDQSPMGLWWKSHGHKSFNAKGEQSLPVQEVQEEVSLRDRNTYTGGNAKPNFAKKKDFKKKNCKLRTTLLSSIILKSSTEFLSVTLSVNSQTRKRRSTDRTDLRGLPALGVAEMEAVDPRHPDTSSTTPAFPVEARALLDSGSLAGDFINNKTLLALKGQPYIRKTDTPLRVCSGLDNACVDSFDVIDIQLSFLRNNIKYTMILQMRISGKSEVDVILGRDTIRKYNLADLCPEFFFKEKVNSAGFIDLKKARNTIPKGIPVMKSVRNHSHREDTGITHGCCMKQPSALFVECTSTLDAAALSDGTHSEMCIPRKGRTVHPRSLRRVHCDDTPLTERTTLAMSSPSLAPLQTTNLVVALLRQTEQLPEVNTLQTSTGDDDIDYDKQDMFAPFRNYGPTITSDEQFLSRITFGGDQELQTAMKKLCLKYRNIFSDHLDPKPASIPPFDLQVDKKIWEVYKNRGPVRVQSTIKQIEIHKQVQEMLKAGIIEKSNAAYYSQVMLTPKPNGDFRFCADYRAMNDATEPASWPIPNIKHLLARLGRHKADTFGVMDLTQGYHQAPLTKGARVFTAFITFAGVYQFTRLPFGPKRAPSYFQEMMASVVLLGLLYMICEMYIDDCIIYGAGSKQFLERVEILFQRFSEKNIKLKAVKCKFGLPIVEYVGRELSKDGITISDNQKRAVMNFPQPVLLTELRSFLGVVNYFRDWVPNHSNVVSPLHKMIDHAAHKKSLLVWTTEGEEAYLKVRDLISRSPLLYFMSDTAPIVLMTDASDYGVGGYLYQMVDNKEQVVALVSKSLTETQLKWSVIQKEAYAIFFCCKELDFLLRDRKFTILTDHKNLTFIKEDSNPMVVRWYTAMQELDYDIKYVAGAENSIADAMSRLCENPKKAQQPERVSSLLAALHSPAEIEVTHYETIARCHNEIVGHGGVERTIRKIKDLKLTWDSMRAEVKQYIRECPCCQKMSQIKTPINVLKFSTSTYRPMECLNIDFIGPYPDKGYVLVIVDTFSRWTELFATHDASAKSATRCLLEHFGRFGCPSFIRSDNGPHFVNELIKLFLLATGTAHNRTLAYSSEENAIVERSNKEVNRHIRAYIFHRGSTDNYQEVLPFVQRIINSAENARTKTSPAAILFGNAVNLDRGILLPEEEQLAEQSLTKASSKMLQMQTIAIKTAQEALKSADELHRSSSAHEITEFAPNSYVLAAQRSAPETRLHTLWRGPFRVIKNVQAEYTLLDLTSGKEKQYHATQLRAFHFNPLRTDPADIARRDYLEFFVESIVKFQGSFDKLTSLRFLVKWLGYDESHNTWEPWKNLRKATALHLFLISKNLKSKIPKEFQTLYEE